MKNTILLLSIILMLQSQGNCHSQDADFEKYPGLVLSNEDIKMKVYLPDPENGIYRATRYDWSGVIGSVEYKGHEYFGYWRDVYDPEDGMIGPADTYKIAGLGYDEAEPGDKFIRIGVGFIQKEDEPEYDYHNSYKLVDPGKWEVDNGEDWISYTHIINSDFGYGYIYKKVIRLKENGFEIEHKLKNTGAKTIETDQYSHNFFMIDNEKCGPDFKISYPYPVSTKDDLKGLMEVKDNTLYYTRVMERNSVFMALEGYGKEAKDNKFTIENTKTGAGVTVSVDQPLHKLEFWTNGLVICPENTMLIHVEPGKEQIWTSDYTLSAQDLSNTQQGNVHPYWAPRTWELRPDDITTIMGFRAELTGNLAHADRPTPTVVNNAFIRGFKTENDIMTWEVDAPYEASYTVALLYTGSKEILSQSTLEVTSGATTVIEKAYVPGWEGKPVFQKHYFKKNIFLKKVIHCYYNIKS